jgi:hypothetical protein
MAVDRLRYQINVDSEPSLMIAKNLEKVVFSKIVGSVVFAVAPGCLPTIRRITSDSLGPRLLEVVKLLLTANADVNRVTYRDERALYRAIKRGKLEAVKLLVDANAEVDERALSVAVECGGMDVVKMLLAAKCVKKGGPLTEASYDLAIIKLILWGGAKTQWKNDYTLAAFEMAVERENSEIIMLFLEGGVVCDRDEPYTKAVDFILADYAPLDFWDAVIVEWEEEMGQDPTTRVFKRLMNCYGRHHAGSQ